MAGTEFVFRIKGDASGAVAASNEAGKSLNNVKRETDAVNVALGKTAALIGSAFAIGELISFGKELTKISAEYDSLNRRLNSLYENANEGTSKMIQLQNQTKALGLEFKSTTEQFYQFVAAAKASGMGINQAERIFSQMTKAIAGSGATAEQAQRAFVALTQMIGKGKIQAEELRGQLGEALPSAVGIMAQSLHVSVAELGKMADSGKLLSSEVLPAFAEEMENVYGPQAQEMAKGQTAQTNRLMNAWEQYKASLGKRLSTGAAVQGLADLIEWWKELNETAQEYYDRVNGEHAGRAAENARKEAAQLKEGGKSDNERIKILRDKAKVLIEYYNENKDLQNDEKIRMGNLTKAYLDEAKLIEEVVESKRQAAAQGSQLTDKQIKDIERKRREEAKAAEEALAYRAKIHAQVFDVSDLSKYSSNVPKPEGFKEIDRGKMREDKLSKLDLEKAKGLKSEEEYNQEKLTILYDYIDLSDSAAMEAYKFSAELTAQDVANYKAGVDEKKQADRDALASKRAKLEMEAQMISQGVASVAQFGTAVYQREEQSLAIALNKKAISEEQYQAKMRQIKKKEMTLNKIAAVTQIAINTAVGVSSALSAVATAPLVPFIIGMGAAEAAAVIAQPIPYAKGTKAVPLMRGAVRGKDSVNAILMPGERVVPTHTNETPGYRELLDDIQDHRISPGMASFLHSFSVGKALPNAGVGTGIDKDTLAEVMDKAIGRIPTPTFSIDERGVAVITERQRFRASQISRKL